MSFVRLYMRVLKCWGEESRLGWTLALANMALAAAQFAEPVLFGRIVDALAGAQARRGAGLDRPGHAADGLGRFGLFTIVCGALVALHADRLAHRRRQVVMTDYFEHILQLPLSFHGGVHSGRLMKIMLTGTDSLWWLWLGFFREHFAAFVSLLVLLPLSLFLNWRLALLLIVLCVRVRAAHRAGDAQGRSRLQSAVERHYCDLAERASDALGNVALVQSFARIDAEVVGLKSVVEQLLGAQMPVLSWWALCAVLTRASTTLTVLSIFLVGIWLNIRGLTTVGEIVTFMAFAGLLITRLEQAVGFANRLFLDAPRLREFFDVLDTEPAVRDRPDAIDPGRVRGLVEFEDVSFSYDGKRPAVADLNFTALPGETVALVGPTGAGKSTALALLHRAFDPQSGSIKIDGMDIRGLKLAALRRNIGVVFQEVLLFNRSIAENLRVGNPDATDDGNARRPRRARRRSNSSSATRKGSKRSSASAAARSPVANASALSIARALAQESADPDPRRGDQRARRHDRAEGAGRARRGDEGPHHLRDRAPAFDRAQRTRILVFDQGRIVESGSFDELVRQGGAFAALAKAQFLTVSSEPGAPTADTAKAAPAAETTTDSPPVAAREATANRITEDAAE